MLREIRRKWHTQGKQFVQAVGLSTDEKPSGNLVTGSSFYEIDSGTTYRFEEEKGKWIAADNFSGRIVPHENSHIVSGNIVDVVGIPEYVDDPAKYSVYGITQAGWYTFARIESRNGETVDGSTKVTGAAGYIATIGNTYIDLAVRFSVAAMSQTVVVNWGDSPESIVFKATDLAIRNLDSRITFYLYDISPFVTWSYALTTDATFVAGKKYYTQKDGVYTLAEVTAGASVPANTYYNHSKLHFEGMTRNVTYRLDEMVDCPIEIALPEIEDDGYGAWFEIQMRYNGGYSCTLLPPSGVKIGTATTHSFGAGINIVDLQYTNVDDVKMWTLLNTHSKIPS